VPEITVPLRSRIEPEILRSGSKSAVLRVRRSGFDIRRVFLVSGFSSDCPFEGRIPIHQCALNFNNSPL
jgi:hypothetical protein